jgi:hypothetical protein
MLLASSSLLEWEFSLHKHKMHKMKKNLFVGPSRRFIWIRPPAPRHAKLHKMVCLIMGILQWRSLSLSLSILQWKNSKNKTLKYWSHNSLAELSVYVLIIQLQFLKGFHSFPLYTEHPKQVSSIPHHLISHYISGAHWRVSSLFLFFFLLA